jgi:hypothetical protein
MGTDKLKVLFTKLKTGIFKSNGESKTSGELIAEATNGANLVDGKQTWEHVEEKEHDLDYMKKCCEAELNTMDKAGIVPAPYFLNVLPFFLGKKKTISRK